MAVAACSLCGGRIIGRWHPASGLLSRRRPNRRTSSNTLRPTGTDAMNVAAACGSPIAAFQPRGHDWGASIAWALRIDIRTVLLLSLCCHPHPNAFNRALQMPDGEQARRSQNHRAFWRRCGIGLTADNARRLRERLAKSGVPKSPSSDISPCSATNGDGSSFAWYRARGAIRAPLGMISVPVLYLWGDAGRYRRTLGCGRHQRIRFWLLSV